MGTLDPRAVLGSWSEGPNRMLRRGPGEPSWPAGAVARRTIPFLLVIWLTVGGCGDGGWRPQVDAALDDFESGTWEEEGTAPRLRIDGVDPMRAVRRSMARVRAAGRVLLVVSDHRVPHPRQRVEVAQRLRRLILAETSLSAQGLLISALASIDCPRGPKAALKSRYAEIKGELLGDAQLSDEARMRLVRSFELLDLSIDLQPDG